MKLLLDENLSAKLVDLLADVYPGSASVLLLGLGGSSDDLVWDYAKRHEFTIVSKDSDFFNRSAVSGAPPKVIWVRLGNCSTASIAMLLRNSSKAVLRFSGGEETCLMLGRR